VVEYLPVSFDSCSRSILPPRSLNWSFIHLIMHQLLYSVAAIIGPSVVVTAHDVPTNPHDSSKALTAPTAATRNDMDIMTSEARLNNFGHYGNHFTSDCIVSTLGYNDQLVNQNIDCHSGQGEASSMRSFISSFDSSITLTIAPLAPSSFLSPPSPTHPPPGNWQPQTCHQHAKHGRIPKQQSPG